MRIRWDLVNVAVVLVLAVVVRLGALGLEGHNGDVSVMARWAERMAEVGPWPFYAEGETSIYPALLYPLWVLAVDLDGAALAVAIKGLSIPFDIGIGIVLYALVRSRASEIVALAAAGLYLFNPAVLLAGPVWGQVDSAGTLAYLAALLASAWRRDGIAGGLGLVAAFSKPQFGLVLLPVLIVAGLRAWRARRIGPIAAALGGVAVAWIVVGGPLALHPLRYAELFANTASQQPFVSLLAFNPWGLLIGFGRIPDDPYVGFASLLLLVGIAGALSGLRRGDDLATLLAVGAVLVLAFYFLPTRVHERYLFPAMALLVPFAVASIGQLVAYVALAVGFAASLLYALHDITPFNLPDRIAAAVVSPAGAWTIGLVLIGAAVAWTWLLLVSRPRLPEPRGDPAA
jgi:Gpi18-like mannosyltransferase